MALPPAERLAGYAALLGSRGVELGALLADQGEQGGPAFLCW